MTDLETLHQHIYKAAHDRMRPFLDDEKLANAVWLATEDAAKALIEHWLPKRSINQPVTADDRGLLPCPFCGLPLTHGSRKINPHARCTTEDCYGAKMPVVNLDVPQSVAAWNIRALTALERPWREVALEASGALVREFSCEGFWSNAHAMRVCMAIDALIADDREVKP